MVELWYAYIWPAAWIVIKIVAIVLPVLIAVAYLTYAERKVIGSIHLRRGPNVVGPFGLLQPIADGLKLFIKETIIPSGANRGVFILAPCVTFSLALMAWAVIPFDDGMVLADINVGILYLFAGSSMGALVGSFYTSGKSPAELEQIALGIETAEIASVQTTLIVDYRPCRFRLPPIALHDIVASDHHLADLVARHKILLFIQDQDAHTADRQDDEPTAA